MDFLSSIDRSWPGGARVIGTVLSAALGALSAAVIPKISHRGLCVLISFAAGALLGVAGLHLLPEAVEGAGLVPALACGVLGYGFFFLVSKYISHVCPACSATHAEFHFQSVTGPLVAALSVHSFIDGLALYGHVTEASGLIVFLAVLLHKFPEGLALTLVARNSGMTARRAFGLAAFVETVTTLLGAWAGADLMGGDMASWASPVMAFVAGTFVFLVFHALLSELFKHHPRSTVLSALLGVALIGLAGFLGGH